MEYVESRFWWVVADAEPPLSELQGATMLFQQTTPPTGWTKVKTHHNKALRVVNNTAGSGGTFGFTTLFGQIKNTRTHTLLESEIPAHWHYQFNITNANRETGTKIFNSTTRDLIPASEYVSTPTTDKNYVMGVSTGGHVGAGRTVIKGSSGAHRHTVDMRVAYVDLILATKD